MARDDGDFEDFLLARWSMIEATLVRVGCPERLVHTVATRGLVRCRGSWQRARRDDPDVWVLGEVLRQARSRVSLTEVHEALVDVAGLRPDQVVRVLDSLAGPVRRRPPGIDSEVPPPTGPPALGAIAAEARSRRAHRVRSWTAGLATAVAGVALLAILGRPTGAPRDATPVWYADGILHGGSFTIAIPRVRRLLRLAEGAAYVDGGGGVYLVDRDGRARRIGSSASDVAPTSSGEGTRLAWLDEVGGGRRVVVYNVPAERVVGKLDLDAHVGVPNGRAARVRLLALDEITLRLAIDGKDFRWQVGSADIEDDGAGLVDVAGSTVARVRADGLEVENPYLGPPRRIEGVAAELSPDGNFVLSTASSSAGESGTSRPHRVLIHDAISGERLSSGLARDELVLDSAFSGRSAITYLVVPARDPASGAEVEVEPLIIVRTCELTTMACHDLEPLEPGRVRPLLAR